MFSNPVKPSSNSDEGTVLQVDAIRLVCKVKTISGQNLDGVQWQQPVGGSSRAGDRTVPTLGDRVKLDYTLGYPMIVGFPPRMQTADNKFPLSIDTGQVLVDTGNYSSDGVNAIADQNKPPDMLVGDRVLASIGGGMVALLRAGSVLLRSSRLSEIYLCKWDDLVRIVSRNWEQFTDVSSDIVKNLRGRIYRYTGYTNTTANSQAENYQYNLYYGDTALAETIKTNYQNPPGSLPSINSTIFKEQVSGDSGELMHRTVDLSGAEETFVTGGGTLTRMLATGSQLTFSFGDQNTITVNATEIQANFNGQQIITLNGSQITLVHSAGATIVMDGSGIKSTFGGGVVNQNSSEITSTFGGHFITVDAGGVHMG